MSRELLILRHAKSDWSQEVGDFERPLDTRGVRDAARIGQWMRAEHIQPKLILSSPARRAAQTTEAVVTALGVGPAAIVWDERLYLASVPDLLEVLAGVTAPTRTVLVIGHNPGLEDLLLWLAPGAEGQRHQEKLLTTATVAALRLPTGDWTLQRHSAVSVRIVRARDLE